VPKQPWRQKKSDFIVENRAPATRTSLPDAHSSKRTFARASYRVRKIAQPLRDARVEGQVLREQVKAVEERKTFTFTESSRAFSVRKLKVSSTATTC
jgi:hypothetical protein